MTSGVQNENFRSAPAFRGVLQIVLPAQDAHINQRVSQVGGEFHPGHGDESEPRVFQLEQDDLARATVHDLGEPLEPEYPAR